MDFYGGEGYQQRFRQMMDDLSQSAQQPGHRSSSHLLSNNNPLSSNARVNRIRRQTHSSRTNELNEARRRRSHALSGDNNANSSATTTANSSDTNGEESPLAKKRKLNRNDAQVEMAQLELELAYCDGGKWKDTRARPESVLYQDDSVYCTRGSYCNMIFKHPGDRCFTLEKLIIQGPADGYTSPVQEGIIFVTMDKNDLIAGCKYPFRFEPTASDEEDDDDDEEDEDIFDDSDGDVEPNDLELPRLASHMRSNSPNNFLESVTSSNRNNSMDEGQPTAAVAAAAQTPIEPSARFKIHKGDSGRQIKATLTFEPALSGRYILARFASPNKHHNIDIQFIGAYGYVGRRYFPSITPR